MILHLSVCRQQEGGGGVWTPGQYQRGLNFLKSNKKKKLGFLWQLFLLPFHELRLTVTHNFLFRRMPGIQMVTSKQFQERSNLIKFDIFKAVFIARKSMHYQLTFVCDLC